MSVVTNLLLAFSILEDEQTRIEEVQRFPFHLESGLKSISDSDAYGGTKHMEQPLWAGAFNYLDLEAFMGHLRQEVAWEYPDEVRLMVCEQDDEAYRMLTLSKEGS